MKGFKLEDIEKKEHPFITPEGYFEELNASILEKTSVEKTPVFARSVQKVWRVAALGILAAVVLFFIFIPKEENSDWLAEVSDEEIINYLASYEYDDLDLLSEFSNEELQAIWADDLSLDNLDLDDRDVEDLYFEYELTEELLEI